MVCVLIVRFNQVLCPLFHTIEFMPSWLDWEECFTGSAFLMGYILDLLIKVVIITAFPYKRVQFSSVAQSCPTPFDPMNHSTPGLPVHHQLLEFPQTHVHRFGDAIQPFHPLSSPSPPAPNPSQH